MLNRVFRTYNFSDRLRSKFLPCMRSAVVWVFSFFPSPEFPRLRVPNPIPTRPSFTLCISPRFFLGEPMRKTRTVVARIVNVDTPEVGGALTPGRLDPSLRQKEAIGGFLLRPALQALAVVGYVACAVILVHAWSTPELGEHMHKHAGFDGDRRLGGVARGTSMRFLTIFDA